MMSGEQRSRLSRSPMRQNPLVQLCGGLGSATTLVYPTANVLMALSTRWPQSRIRK